MDGLFRIAGVADIFSDVCTGDGSRPHFHDSYSIGIFAGDSRIRCRGAMHELRDGQFAVLEPGEAHGGHCGVKLNRQDGIVLDPAMVMRLFSAERPVRFENPVIDDPELARMLQAAVRSRDGTAVEAAVTCLFRRHGKPLPESRRANCARTAAECSIATQSSGRRLSRSHYSRKMKALLGLAPRDYRRQRRVEAARTMIEQGRELAEVAAETGFSDQAHMTRQMRSLLGITPGMLRKGER